jgi:hypothetical protein
METITCDICGIDCENDHSVVYYNFTDYDLCWKCKGKLEYKKRKVMLDFFRGKVRKA